jgi:hypothetical protein
MEITHVWIDKPGGLRGCHIILHIGGTTIPASDQGIGEIIHNSPTLSFGEPVFNRIHVILGEHRVQDSYSDEETCSKQNHRGRLSTVGVVSEVGVTSIIGVSVGIGIGVSVGTGVGVAVGIEVGVAVRIEVGVAVGVSVGVAVGVEISVAVGVGI